MRVIRAMIQVIYLMSAGRPDHCHQSRLIRVWERAGRNRCKQAHTSTHTHTHTHTPWIPCRVFWCCVGLSEAIANYLANHKTLRRAISMSALGKLLLINTYYECVIQVIMINIQYTYIQYMPRYMMKDISYILCVMVFRQLVEQGVIGERVRQRVTGWSRGSEQWWADCI